MAVEVVMPVEVVVLQMLAQHLVLMLAQV